MGSQLTIILVSILLSAFFSGVEIAFLSANRLKLELDRKKGGYSAKVIELFARHPGQFISTMLVGNNIALVVYGIAMASMLDPFLQPYFATEAAVLGIKTLLSTLIILFTAEFLPKALFRINPNSILSILAFPITLFYIIFYPISKLASTLSYLILRVVFRVKIEDNKHKTLFDKIDLTDLVNESPSQKEEETGHVHDMIIFKNALNFQDLRVRDCMVTRTQIEGIEVGTGMDEVLQLFIQTNFSRLLIFRESKDDIIGYINSKDLFHKPASLDKMIKPIDFVPETMPAHKLLSNLIKSHKNLAVVVDEFGGTAGMVTLEDLMEEIFGEIEDEHDSDDSVEKQLNPNEFVFSGRLEVDYLNQIYHLEIPESDDYETIAGYIFFQNKSIPAQGEILIFDGMRVKILKMSGIRVDLIHLTVLV
ncbi:hemolysin family protein [Williamwhitmania taraxaci]|uniref:Hemolysin, contains CBS domains n=1 Tax=Williamwhitmania taraxaci TaxID=1640674 RepID=A0A1G6L5N6_9BACT|nr:hemolysin family protein [Williamwhitmania taraxaci]SDC38622.1 Hemolysin, contains CBS domains [Williamwhitmania taraxaci]